ncbi:MAG: tetraacyldisaccharide 4'-kinase [Rickettsiales bacterium]|jgi:tetraacyldisaccharide 4'-kinase|nr:tetraacyldisaccharide 4'-kinase [Rickettsiales bacterium]
MKLIAPKFWKTRNIFSLLLYPLSIIYNLISSYFSSVPENKRYQPKAKVIRVGNITMGGAGKTPVVLSLAKILNKYKIAILTRGYKGSLTGPVMLNKHHKIDEVGDEALLLFKKAPTCVAKNRLQGIKYLESLGYELIITDDGMQDNRFKPYLTIMVIDGHSKFGNKMIFPAGPLRESIESGVKQANFAVIIGEGKLDYQLPILQADLTSKTNFKAQKFIAFAGIGNPDKFFHSVEKSGGRIIEKLAFADHYKYTQKDIENLIAKGHKLITTEKDYVRIDPKYHHKIKVLPVDLVWRDEEQLQKLLAL